MGAEPHPPLPPPPPQCTDPPHTTEHTCNWAPSVNWTWCPKSKNYQKYMIKRECEPSKIVCFMSDFACSIISCMYV